MKFNFKKAIVRGLLSLSVLAGSLLSAIPVSANTASLSIADQSIGNTATTFTVDINITTDVPTPGTQVSIAWDPAKLDLQSRSFTDNVYATWFDDYLIANPETSAQIQNMNGSLNQSAGTLTGMASSILGDVGGPTPSNGLLVRLTFLRQVVDADVEIAIQTDAKVKDMENENIPLTTDNGVITIGDPNSGAAPDATDVAVSVDEDEMSDPITLTATDVNGDPITYSIETGPANGTVYEDGTAISSFPQNLDSNVVTYQGNVSDSFTFKATDKDGNDTATVTVTVTEVNDPPVAVDMAVSTDEDTILSESSIIELETAVTDNDTAHLDFYIVTLPDSGTLYDDTVEIPDTVTLPYFLTSDLYYVPDSNYNGSDSFTFKAYDGESYSNIANVAITVNPENDPPTADDASVEVNKDEAKVITLTGADIDEDTLSFVIKSLPASGDLSDDNGPIAIDDTVAGVLSYTPDADYIGDDSFTFLANDGTVDSDPATISIEVKSGAIDVDGTKYDYITFTAPAGDVTWDFVVDDTTTAPYNDGVGEFRNTDLDMGVFANTPWQVQIKTVVGEPGHMTKWNGSTYVVDTYLTDPLKINATGPVDREGWVALSGSEQTVSSTLMSDYNGTSTYDLDFDLEFYQYVYFSDPGLPDGYTYHTVVQFTCVPTTY